jgi:sporulation protein YlmC with PRC-barrel domain
MTPERDPSARRLERLSRLDEFEVDRTEPDPRGWTVVNRDGRGVGEVKDLIVDTERLRATYLDVELDSKLFDLRGDDPHVLVPVERAHRDGKRLVVDDIGPDWVGRLREERQRYDREFWDRWWTGGDARPVDEGAPRIARRVAPGELDRAIEEVRPGESVRIPVVGEEIVIERRPVVRDEPLREDVVVNRAGDEPPRRR